MPPDIEIVWICWDLQQMDVEGNSAQKIVLYKIRDAIFQSRLLDERLDKSMNAFLVSGHKPLPAMTGMAMTKPLAPVVNQPMSERQTVANVSQFHSNPVGWKEYEQAYQFAR